MFGHTLEVRFAVSVLSSIGIMFTLSCFLVLGSITDWMLYLDWIVVVVFTDRVRSNVWYGHCHLLATYMIDVCCSAVFSSFVIPFRFCFFLSCMPLLLG